MEIGDWKYITSLKTPHYCFGLSLFWNGLIVTCEYVRQRNQCPCCASTGDQLRLHVIYVFQNISLRFRTRPTCLYVLKCAICSIRGTAAPSHSMRWPAWCPSAFWSWIFVAFVPFLVVFCLYFTALANVEAFKKITVFQKYIVNRTGGEESNNTINDSLFWRF